MKFILYLILIIIGYFVTDNLEYIWGNSITWFLYYVWSLSVVYFVCYDYLKNIKTLNSWKEN